MRREATLFGVVTVIFWLSLVPYLLPPPFALSTERKQLVAEARDARGPRRRSVLRFPERYSPGRITS